MKVTIITPQFERSSTDPAPACPPVNFSDLHEMDRNALLELGCRVWNSPEDHNHDGWPHPGSGLLLFPGEWYSSIPEGFLIVDINGKVESFETEITSDDIRFGCLAYGVLRP